MPENERLCHFTNRNCWCLGYHYSGKRYFDMIEDYYFVNQKQKLLTHYYLQAYRMVTLGPVALIRFRDAIFAEAFDFAASQFHLIWLNLTS